MLHQNFNDFIICHSFNRNLSFSQTNHFSIVIGFHVLYKVAFLSLSLIFVSEIVENNKNKKSSKKILRNRLN